MFYHLGVSKNRGTLKSSILIGFSIINHPFWGTPIFGNIHFYQSVVLTLSQKVSQGFAADLEKQRGVPWRSVFFKTGKILPGCKSHGFTIILPTYGINMYIYNIYI